MVQRRKRQGRYNGSKEGRKDLKEVQKFGGAVWPDFRKPCQEGLRLGKPLTVPCKGSQALVTADDHSYFAECEV